MFKIVAYYTEGTVYQDIIKTLQESLEYLGLDYHLYPTTNLGSWEENTGQKPFILRQALKDFPDHDILYVDADAVVHTWPDFEIQNWDIGVYYTGACCDKSRVRSGTIFLRNCQKVAKIIDQWCEEQTEDELDQEVLGRVLKDNKNTNLWRLPVEFCAIYDTDQCDDPVIEHFQASRKHRRLLVDNKNLIPQTIGGMRPRVHADGSFSLPRCNQKIETILEQDYIKLKNENRWFPKKEYETIRGAIGHMFQDQIVTIVGKGPSLDYLHFGHLGDGGPVLAINESIHKVEEICLEKFDNIFMIQQDDALQDTCRPEWAGMIVSRRAAKAYLGSSKLHVYYPEVYNLSQTSLSVQCAIAISKSLGAAGFRLVCFDSATTGELGYAKTIGHQPNGSPDRYKSHRLAIQQQAGGLPIEWITPESPEKSFDDTPQQLQDNPEEHHEHDAS